MQNDQTYGPTHDEYLIDRNEVAKLCGISYSCLCQYLSGAFHGRLRYARKDGKTLLYKRKDVLEFKEYLENNKPKVGGRRNRTNFKDARPSNKLLDQLLRTKKLLADEILKQQQAFNEICKVINSLTK